MPLACSGGGASLSVIDHGPLYSSLPLMITCSCLMILTPYLVESSIQSSSHSWLREMSVPVLRLSRIKTGCDAVVRADDSCSCLCARVGMTLPLAVSGGD